MILCNDRVLIERLPEREGLIIKPDIANSKGIEGIVRAVGPGKWIPGEWWYCTKELRHSEGKIGNLLTKQWEWIPGYRQELDVKVGQRVLFHSKWNDLAMDFTDDLPLGANPRLHVIQEADIFGILP